MHALLDEAEVALGSLEVLGMVLAVGFAQRLVAAGRLLAPRLDPPQATVGAMVVLVRSEAVVALREGPGEIEQDEVMKVAS